MSGEQNDREAEILRRLRSIEEPAPQELHRRIEALVEQRSAAGWPRTLLARGLLGARGARAPRPALAARLLAAVAVAGACIAIALALAGRSAPAPLPLREAAALALAPASAAPPGADPRHRGELAAGVQGVAFPYWEDTLGWRAIGAGSGRLAGRAVETVLYANARGQRVTYAILAGRAPGLGGGVARVLGGRAYRVLSESATRAVAWVRGGHLCIVAARGVDPHTLLALASWGEGGASASQPAGQQPPAGGKV